MGSKRASSTVRGPLPRFQTDPCGVEALSHGLFGRPRRFQTDPCGVEASSTNSFAPSCGSFQTDPCGVEARRRSIASPRFGCPSGGHPVSDGPLWGRSNREVADSVLRQDVSDGPLWGRSLTQNDGWLKILKFQTDPCGVEATGKSTGSRASASFRRTLVGSKRQRRAGGTRDGTVSDGPLWGRSLIGDRGTEYYAGGFRRTLVGSKQNDLAI